MTTIEEVKQFLNIVINDQDVFIGSLIPIALSRMNNICHRNLTYNNRTDIIDGKEQTVLFLKNYPVNEIDSINFRENTDGFVHSVFQDKALIDNVYLIKKSGKVVLLNDFYLPAGISNIEINYSAGYTPDPPIQECEIPADLRSVCLMMTVELFLKSYQTGGTDEDDRGETGRRFGLGRMEHTRDDGTVTERRVYIYKEEEYERILRKYKGVKI